jgi:hypothetical protein
MHSTDGTSGGYYMSPHKKYFFPFHISLHWCTCTQYCWMFVAQIYTFFFLPSSTHVRGLSLFLLYIPCYLPPNYPSLKCLNSCVNLTAVVQWLRLALSKGPNWVGVFFPPFTWARKQIQFPKRRVPSNTGRWIKTRNPEIPRDEAFGGRRTLRKNQSTQRRPTPTHSVHLKFFENARAGCYRDIFGKCSARCRPEHVLFWMKLLSVPTGTFLNSTYIRSLPLPSKSFPIHQSSYRSTLHSLDKPQTQMNSGYSNTR